MTDTTPNDSQTNPPASTPGSQGIDWEARYKGLDAALQRDYVKKVEVEAKYMPMADVASKYVPKPHFDTAVSNLSTATADLNAARAQLEQLNGIVSSISTERDALKTNLGEVSAKEVKASTALSIYSIDPKIGSLYQKGSLVVPPDTQDLSKWVESVRADLGITSTPVQTQAQLNIGATPPTPNSLGAVGVNQFESMSASSISKWMTDNPLDKNWAAASAAYMKKLSEVK